MRAAVIARTSDCGVCGEGKGDANAVIAVVDVAAAPVVVDVVDASVSFRSLSGVCGVEAGACASPSVSVCRAPALASECTEMELARTGTAKPSPSTATPFTDDVDVVDDVAGFAVAGDFGAA